MGKLLFTLGIVLSLGFLVVSAPACTDSCSQLSEVCDLCTDKSYEGACITTVESNNQSLCGESIANYRLFCTGGDGGGSSVSSTTTSASGSGGAGGSSGATGGAGGSAGGTAGAGGVAGTGGTGG